MDIIGHEAQKQQLTRYVSKTLEGQSVEHAFVFSGMSSIGKRTIALCVAKALVESVEPVWVVDRDMRLSANVLVVTPEREEKKTKKGVQVRYKDISALQIRGIRKALAHSVKGERVVLIEDADRMSLTARNALLKVLEEPPERTTFFLITSDAARLSETILSRASFMQFYPLTKDQFIENDIGDEDAFIKSLGCVGQHNALEASDEMLEKASYALQSLSDLKNMALHERLHLAESESLDASSCADLLSLWTAKIHHVAHTHKRYDLLLLTEKIDAVRREIRTSSTNRRLLMEQLLITL